MMIRLLSVMMMLAPCLLWAAEAKPATPVAEPAWAGKFAGKWSADEGSAGGDFEIVLRQGDKGEWVAESLFTFEGARIPGRTQSVTIEGAKLVLVFDWQIQDTLGRTTVKGELAGDALGGAYESQAGDAKTRGTWRLTRVPGPAPKKA